MRINKYLAKATGLSRRAADKIIAEGRVLVDGQTPEQGQDILGSEQVTIDGESISLVQDVTIMMNKPVGFVCSRKGQGSRTIYELLPEKYQNLKSIGRLDKESSGLILLTSEGDLANELTHPSHAKQKRYLISLNKPLEPLHQQMVSDVGIMLEDGPSKLILHKSSDDRTDWEVVMSEGRNRQIRRTFESIGYKVVALHRTTFANYKLGELAPAQIKEINSY